MLVELSINPFGSTNHWSKDLAGILDTIEQSGLPYCLTPSGTCIEGEWDEVMALVQLCHYQTRSSSTRVLTTLRIEDEEGAVDKLTENVASVQRAIGHDLRCMLHVFISNLNGKKPNKKRRNDESQRHHGRRSKILSSR